MVMLLAIGSGCQCEHNHVSNVTQPAPTYTVEILPAPRPLTPTSREGDKSRVVYSSNIAAVYLNTNGVNASLTNAPLSRTQTGKMQGR
jgi:hypothetical protein